MTRKNTMISKKALKEEETPQPIQTFVETGAVDTSKQDEPKPEAIKGAKKGPTKQLVVKLDEDVHTRLKIKSIQDGTTMTEIVEALVLQFLDDHK